MNEQLQIAVCNEWVRVVTQDHLNLHEWPCLVDLELVGIKGVTFYQSLGDTLKRGNGFTYSARWNIAHATVDVSIADPSIVSMGNARGFFLCRCTHRLGRLARHESR